MYDSRFHGRRNVKNYIVLGIIVVSIMVAVFVSGILPIGDNEIVSPVPDSNTVRIIFVTPEPKNEATVAGEKNEKEETDTVETAKE